MKLEKGSLVVYKNRELGVVKSVNNDTSFVFYHTGGTVAKTLNNELKSINKEDIKNYDLNNHYAIKSLIERKRRIDAELDINQWNDLIDL